MALREHFVFAVQIALLIAAGAGLRVWAKYDTLRDTSNVFEYFSTSVTAVFEAVCSRSSVGSRIL